MSSLRKQAADALRRARKLPIGAERNDLRQLAVGLLWLDRNGMDALVKQRLDSAASAETSFEDTSDMPTGSHLASAPAPTHCAGRH